MPPPAWNDTGKAFCFANEEEAEMRRTEYRRSELVTLIVDLETGKQYRTCRGIPSCQFW